MQGVNSITVMNINTISSNVLTNIIISFSVQNGIVTKDLTRLKMLFSEIEVTAFAFWSWTFSVIELKINVLLRFI